MQENNNNDVSPTKKGKERKNNAGRKANGRKNNIIWCTEKEAKSLKVILENLRAGLGEKIQRVCELENKAIRKGKTSRDVAAEIKRLKIEISQLVILAINQKQGEYWDIVEQIDLFEKE